MVEPEEGMALLTLDDLPGLAEGFPRRLVQIPEWGKAVWVWGRTLADQRRGWSDAEVGTDDVDKINRGRIARILDAVRVSGALAGDKPPAKLFSREKHWQFVADLPLSVMDRLLDISQALDGEQVATQEQIRGFFALLAAVNRCLLRTASACECCTDCPENSQETCPRVLSQKLWLPTG